jgi:acetyltransferase
MTRLSDTARDRTLALDGLRGLACVGVLVLHAWMFDHGDAGRPPKGALDVVIGEMRLGVTLFFVLSGFLIYRPFVAAALDGRRSPRLGRYALRRATRILPAYWAAVLGAFVLLIAIDHPQAIEAGSLPRFLLFAQNQADATRGGLDPPLWTLPVELGFYALVPVLGLIVARLGRGRAVQVALPAALLALGAGLIAAAALGHWPKTVTTSLIGNLAPFAAGALVAALLHDRTLRRGAALALIAVGAVLLVGDGAWHGLQLGARTPRVLVGDLPASLGFAAIVAALAASPIRARALTCAPLALLGTLSFGIYLWHFPVIYALRGLHAWPTSLAGAIGATFALTVALAAISWLALERPALRWASARTARSPRPRPALEAPRGAPARPEVAWAAAPGRT